MARKSYIGTLGYRLYKRYVRFINEHLMYSKVYYIDKANLPELGTPCMIVSNHQNCANDPLNLLLGLENESHPFVIARGNVFSWNPLLTKFFLWLGMLPAFRLAYDGEENLKNNAETIRISGGKMMEGNRLIMYPEGTHQDKRWLGDFSYGYTRLLFETAERDNFEHDILLVPAANHYQDYFEPQTAMMIRFGKPISLKPFYELYKQKPRTAQREVNKLVRGQIESMMLDIRDLDHYNELDWLRQSEAGYAYCQTQGLQADYLPDRLTSDKQLVAQAQAKLQENDYEQIRQVMAEEKRLGISENDLMKRKGWATVLLSMVAQICLLPLWIVSLYPNLFHYLSNRPFMRTDKMFTNSWRFIVPVVVGIPFFCLLTVLICGLVWGWWWQSVLWMLLAVYPLGKFAWVQYRWMRSTLRNLKILLRKQEVQALDKQRHQIFDNLKLEH